MTLTYPNHSPQTTYVYLALGSNLGDRIHWLSQAREQVKTIAQSELHISKICKTPPYQGMDQPDYYNQVIGLATNLSATDLLEVCLSIEESLGRTRETLWSPRTIDIDILFYGQEVIRKTGLQIPHYDLYGRGFFLLPLGELDSKWIDPVSQKTIETLIQEWKQNTKEPYPCWL